MSCCYCWCVGSPVHYHTVPLETGLTSQFLRRSGYFHLHLEPDRSKHYLAVASVLSIQPRQLHRLVVEEGVAVAPLNYRLETRPYRQPPSALRRPPLR